MFRSNGHGRAGLAAFFVVLCMCSPAHAGVKSVDGAWTSLSANVPAPSARREHVAIYDAANNRYLMFGGYGYGSTSADYNFNEVWSLTMSDPPTWSLLTVSGTPPGPRKQSQWGYDIARNRLLVFGGYGQHYGGSENVTWQNDVWQLSLLDETPTWTELFPTGTPPTGRLAGISVYDPLRQRFVGFGGTAGAPVDTWSLDLSGDPAWGVIDTGGQNPAGAYGMGCIYDPLRDRMVVFGGSLGEAYFGSQNNTWELTLDDAPAWHQLFPADPTAPLPSPRRSMTAVYDPMRDRMVIYGGFDAQPVSNLFLPDTWALSLSDQLVWHQLSPAGTIPTGRDASAAIYDPTGDRLVVYGGWSGFVMLGDTDYLTWGETPKPASISASGSASPSAASLNWSVSQSTGVHAGVFRKSVGEPWTSIATVTASPTGAVSYVDNDVAPGGHYSYELAVASQRGQFVGGQVAVNIPGALAVPVQPGVHFALRPVSPNPVAGGFHANFALPNSDPARLDVVDVSGRVVVTNEVGALGAGVHHVTLGSARDFAPGMYFVRLSRSGQTLTTRAIVLGGQ